MKNIVINEDIKEKIAESLNKAEKALSTQGYTEAGIEARIACENFATVILETFLGESVASQYKSLDDKIKAIKDNGCMAYDGVDLLFDIKSYGNNVAHPEKSPNFNPETIVSLFPRFKRLIESYFAKIEVKYDNFLARRGSGDVEVYERFDKYITKATTAFVRAWKKAYEENGPIKELYNERIVLYRNYIDNEDKNEIKENLYNATKMFMLLFCKLNGVSEKSVDYLRLLEDMEMIEKHSANSRFSILLKHLDLRYKISNRLNAKINNYEWKTLINNTKIFYKNRSFVIEEVWDKDGDGYHPYLCKIVRAYEVLSCWTFPSIDIKFLEEIRKFCEDATFGGSSWNEYAYSYIRTLHSVGEEMKRGYFSKAAANPMTELIKELDTFIIKIEDQAFEEGLVEMKAFESKLEKDAEDYRAQKKLDTELQIKEAEAKEAQAIAEEAKQKEQLYAKKIRCSITRAAGWISAAIYVKFWFLDMSYDMIIAFFAMAFVIVVTEVTVYTINK